MAKYTWTVIFKWIDDERWEETETASVIAKDIWDALDGAIQYARSCKRSQLFQIVEVSRSHPLVEP